MSKRRQSRWANADSMHTRDLREMGKPDRVMKTGQLCWQQRVQPE